MTEVDGKIKINVGYKRKKVLFSPEEISVMELKKLKETAEYFLHEKVTDVVTSPSCPGTGDLSCWN